MGYNECTLGGQVQQSSLNIWMLLQKWGTHHCVQDGNGECMRQGIPTSHQLNSVDTPWLHQETSGPDWSSLLGCSSCTRRLTCVSKDMDRCETFLSQLIQGLCQVSECSTRRLDMCWVRGCQLSGHDR